MTLSALWEGLRSAFRHETEIDMRAYSLEDLALIELVMFGLVVRAAHWAP